MIGAKQIRVITLTCDQCQHTELAPDLTTLLANTPKTWSVIVRTWPMTDDHFCGSHCLEQSTLRKRGAKAELL